jgi:DNA replication protein DnaC
LLVTSFRRYPFKTVRWRWSWPYESWIEDIASCNRESSRSIRAISVTTSEFTLRVATLVDWGLATLTQDQGRDLLEIVDDRHNRGSTIVTSQLPVDHWHEVIANPTVADAILDRLVHNSHRLTLNGESMRKGAAKRSGLDASPAP